MWRQDCEKQRTSGSEWATRPERADEAASEGACKGSGDEVPGSEKARAERSDPAKRERVERA